MARLGPHCIRATEQALAFARRAPVVKALDDVTPLRVAQPGALRIYRRYLPKQEPWIPPQEVVAAILGGLGDYRHPRLYVELENEPDLGRLDQWIPHWTGCVELLHNAGLKVAVGSFSTGAYEARHWYAMRQARWCGGDILAVHNYFGNEGFTIWNAVRHRQFWLPGDLNICITECGRDRCDGALGGWKRDGVSADQYREELLAYDAEIAKDSYVLGATVFTSGPTEDWAAFNVDDLGLDAALAAPPYEPADAPIVVPPVQPPAPANDQAAIVSALDGCWHWCNQADAAAEALLAANRKLRQEIVELKVALGLQPA